MILHYYADHQLEKTAPYLTERTAFLQLLLSANVDKWLLHNSLPSSIKDLIDPNEINQEYKRFLLNQYCSFAV